MHWQALQFVTTIKDCFPNYFVNSNVIEVGSYSVNGSVRQLFSANKYIGLDLVTGPSVDLVKSGHMFNFSEKFDVSLSCECFEHNPFYKETLVNMINHTRDNGIIILTFATTGRPEHGTTKTDPSLSPGTSSLNWDYYKNLTEEDFNEIDLNNLLSEYVFCKNLVSNDLYFIGFGKKFEVENHKAEVEKIKKMVSFFEYISNNNTLEDFTQMKGSLLSPDCLYFIFRNYSFLVDCYKKDFEGMLFNSLIYFPDSHVLYLLLYYIYKESNVWLAHTFIKRSLDLCGADNGNLLYNLCCSYEDIGDYNKALLLICGVKNFSTSDKLLWKASVICYKDKDVDLGLKYIDMAIGIKSDDPVYLYQKIRLCILGDKFLLARSTAEILSGLDCTPDWILNYLNKKSLL